MKKPEKEFVIGERRPRVLLLGNGLCRAFGGMSWNGLLNELKEKDQYPAEAKDYLMPMPLKAAMLTNNTLATKMRNVVKPHAEQDPLISVFDWSSFIRITQEMKEHFVNLIRDRFDYVLTTNYGYEIEAALLDRENLSKAQIGSLMHFHEVDHAQTKFLVNTFNEVDGIPIWHVHGEARKPDSMIIGNYYYGKLLRRCVDRLDGSLQAEDETGKSAKSSKTNAFRTLIKQNKPVKIGSWIDAFVLGDVYILGFGLDFSETDIWWLLEYKANHRDVCGNTFFYEPQKDTSNKCISDENIQCDKRSHFIDSNQCRNYLLCNTYGITAYDLGITTANGEDYIKFYEQAIQEIIHSTDL